MNERLLWALVRERQATLRAEMCRLRGVPRPAKGFLVALMEKLGHKQPRAGRTRLEASCCTAQ